ncbi:MAG: DUF6273 domain-containing protein [Clostridium sp.]|nr:DUF6273 domain-containing protein [Clostridium sp.]
MAEAIKEIVLDVSKPKALKAIVAKQNDVNSRFIKATLTNSGQIIPIDTGSTITFNVERPDGEVKALIGTLNEDDTVTVPLTQWVLELEGIVRCEISVIDTDSKLTTLSFVISVEENLYNTEDLIQDEDYDLLVTLINRSTQATNACNEAATNANGAANNANQAAENANSAIENIRVLLKADNIEYDPSKSGFNVNNVQEALDTITTRMDLAEELKPKSWEDVSVIVQSGLASKVFRIGDQLICNHSEFGELVWDIIGFDCEQIKEEYEVEHSMTLALHSIPIKVQFDSPEAYFYTASGFPAGSYYFELGTFGTYYVTFAVDVPADAQIVFKWNGTTNPQNIKMDVYADFYAQKVTESLPITQGQVGEPLASYGIFNTPGNHLMYGSNTFTKSALFQYLSSDVDDIKFWEPVTEFDRCPSWDGTIKPFKAGLDSDFYTYVCPVMKKVALNTVTEQGGTEEIEVEFFLLSRDEVGLDSEFADDPEGTPYPYFDSNDARRKYYNDSSTTWWLRTPNSGSANGVRIVSGYGRLLSNGASSSNGVAPACVIA